MSSTLLQPLRSRLRIVSLHFGERSDNARRKKPVTMKHAPGEQVDNVESVESAASMLEELAGMRKLHALQVSLAAQSDMRVALQDITALACTFARTECGCVQLVDEHSNDMELRVYRGHDERSPFVQQFLKDGFQATCDTVRRERRQLVIEDIESFTPLKGTPDYEAALCSGIHAAQFTPLFNRAGVLLGLLSTQFTLPYRPAEHELRLLGFVCMDRRRLCRTQSCSGGIADQRVAAGRVVAGKFRSALPDEPGLGRDAHIDRERLSGRHGRSPSRLADGLHSR